MKPIRTAILFFAAFLSMQYVQAQASDKTQRTIGIKTATIKVAAECHMAGNSIEKAASSVEGIKSASYNEERNELTVKYNVFKKDAVEAVHRKIAAAGFDTEQFKASDSAYEKLPACCRYQRKAS
jgi:cation transport ATPase